MTNMCVQLQHDVSAECFVKQLFDSGNKSLTIDKHTQCINSPWNICKITAFKDDNKQREFFKFCIKLQNHEYLNECAILAAKNNDVNVINFCIYDVIPVKLQRINQSIS